MLKKSAILAVSALAFGGLCIADATAKNAGMKARGHVMKQTFSTSADVDVVPRRSLRRSDRFVNRPHGWSQGRKRGWGCTVGDANCVPPGQQRFID